MSYVKPLLILAALSLATPALAEPTVGLGLSVSFGGGKTQTGLGLRVFSDDRQDSVVAAVGVDYMFNTKTFRGTLGGAYLGTNTYVALEMGLNFNGGDVGYGVSAGGVNTSEPALLCLLCAP